MPVENTTANRGYPLPATTNELSIDVLRVLAAFAAIDTDMAAALTPGAVYASLDSPIFAGNPKAPTQLAGDNSTKLATTAFVAVAVAAIVQSAPGLLDTLEELATALGDDPNFATTMLSALATKTPLSRNMSAGTGLTGGGDMSEDRTINAEISSNLDALAGIRNNVLMSPLRTKEAIAANVNVEQTHINSPSNYAATADRWISPLDTTITTTVDNARVRVDVLISIEVTNAETVMYIERDATEIGSGNASGSRNHGIVAIPYDTDHASTPALVSFSFIDDDAGPAGAKVYSFNIRGTSTICYLNRTVTDADTISNERTVSNIVLTELPPL